MSDRSIELALLIFSAILLVIVILFRVGYDVAQLVRRAVRAVIRWMNG